MSGHGYVFGGEKAQLIKRGIRARKLDALAERISEHGDVYRAGKEIEVSDSYARLLWSDIKKAVGWQAR